VGVGSWVLTTQWRAKLFFSTTGGRTMLLRLADPDEVVHLAQARLLSRHLSHVSCDYQAGILYLRGHSRSFYDKQMAQELVRQVEGVATVVNEVEVGSGVG
jgi:hypothetical protein